MPNVNKFKSVLVLIFHFTLILNSSMVWLTFTSISYRAAEHYQTTLQLVNGLSTVFLVTTLLFGLAAFYILENFGLRKSLIVNAWTCSLGACLRLISTLGVFSSNVSFIILFFGQCLVAIVTPLAIFSPATTAALWFSASKRTLVNAIINLAFLAGVNANDEIIFLVANPVGVIITASSSPRFINEEDKLEDFLLLLPSTILAFGAAILGTFVMTEKDNNLNFKRSIKRKNSMWLDIKKLFRNKNFVILLVSLGGGVGLYSTLLMLFEQIICPFGYSDVRKLQFVVFVGSYDPIYAKSIQILYRYYFGKILAGLCSTTLTASGILGSIIICWYCDHSKQLSTMIKVSFGVVSMGMGAFTIIIWTSTFIGYLVLIIFSFFGLFTMCILPIGIELAIESTHPISEATISGLIQQMGHIQAIIMLAVVQMLGRNMSKLEEIKSGSVCQKPINETELIGTMNQSNFSDNQMNKSMKNVTNFQHSQETVDFSISVFVLACYTTILYLLLMFAFKPQYKRRKMEEKLKLELVIQNEMEDKDCFINS